MGVAHRREGDRRRKGWTVEWRRSCRCRRRRPPVRHCRRRGDAVGTADARRGRRRSRPSPPHPLRRRHRRRLRVASPSHARRGRDYSRELVVDVLFPVSTSLG
jgi:hypothetical protein